jgi:hypothetical protein
LEPALDPHLTVHQQNPTVQSVNEVIRAHQTTHAQRVEALQQHSPALQLVTTQIPKIALPTFSVPLTPIELLTSQLNTTARVEMFSRRALEAIALVKQTQIASRV